MSRQLAAGARVPGKAGVAKTTGVSREVLRADQPRLEVEVNARCTGIFAPYRTDIWVPMRTRPRLAAMTDAQALERLRALPGVLSASQTSALPLMPSGTDCVSLPGGPQLHVSTNAIDLGYFHTMGIGMIAGRDFTSIELPRESSTIVITDSLAKRLWPTTSPIGERISIGCQAPQASVVIGVVRDSAVRDVGEPPQPRFYQPFARTPAASLPHSSKPARTRQRWCRKSAKRFSPWDRTSACMRCSRSAPTSISRSQAFAGWRWPSPVSACSPWFSLPLASTVSSRIASVFERRSIGVRMALGAGRGAIFRDVVWHGLTIAVAGVAIGEVLAIPAIRALASVQAGIRPAAPSTHVAAAVIWVTVAFVASYWPAGRASRVAPMEALRHERRIVSA